MYKNVMMLLAASGFIYLYMMKNKKVQRQDLIEDDRQNYLSLDI